MAISKGNWSANDSNKIIVPANDARTELVIQHRGGDPVYLGFGEPAEGGKGITISEAMPMYVINSYLSEREVYGLCASGDSANGGYQEV